MSGFGKSGHILDALEHDIEEGYENETLDVLHGHFGNNDDEDETLDAIEPQDSPSSATVYDEEPGTSSSSKSCLLILTYFLVTVFIRSH